MVDRYNYNQLFKARHKALGLCVDCKNMAEPGKLRCRKHLDMNCKSVKNRPNYAPAMRTKDAQRRIREGICLDCSRPSEPYRQYCKLHMEQRQARTVKYRKVQVVKKGHCPHCGRLKSKEFDNGYSLCSLCREKRSHRGSGRIYRNYPRDMAKNYNQYLKGAA